MTARHPLAQTSPGAGARALYLGARDKKQVHCTEEALVVRNVKAQTLRYPVARVARIVSSTTVDWSGAALALCMRRGIGITWLDAAGESLGACYPCQRSHPSLATALDLLTDAPDGATRYQNWLRSRRMEVLVRWGKENADRIDPMQWEGVKREWVYQGHVATHLPRPLRSLCLAYVGAQLAAHGLAPLVWDAQAASIDIDHDFCELLWAEMNLHAGALTEKVEAELPTAALFERWNARNAASLLLHLRSLHRLVMKALYA